MLLRLLAIATLATLVAGRTWRCPVQYEALNKTIHRLLGPTTWLDSAAECSRHFPGFEVLMDDWNALSEEDRRLCEGWPVPLGLFQQDGVFWRREIELAGELGSKNRAVHAEVSAIHKAFRTDDDELSDEKVSPSGGAVSNKTHYLDLPSKSPEALGGSLNLTTNQWHLASTNTTFNCVLCQRAWLTSFEELKASTRDRSPYRHSYSASIVKTGDDRVTVTDAIGLLVLKMNGSLVDIKVKADGPGLVVKSREVLSGLELPEELGGAFRIEEWRDMDVCAATGWNGVHWPATKLGYAIGVRLNGSHIATRLCEMRDLPDNDFDAVWQDAVYHWHDHEHDCETKNVQKLLRYIQDFAKWPIDKLQLSSLLAGSSQIRDLSATFDDFDSRRSVAKAVVDALTALMAAPLSENSISAQCEPTSLACVMASPGSDLIYGKNSSVTLKMQFVSPDQVPLVYFSNMTASKELAITLKIPEKLTSDSGFAAHLIQESKKFKYDYVGFLNPTQGYRLLGFDYGVVVHITSAASNTEPVVISVNNADSPDKFQTFRRFLAVWSQSDENGTTLPCPLVAVDGITDTYWCQTFPSGPNNVTAGVFYAYQTRNMILELVANNSITENIFKSYARIRVDAEALSILAHLTNAAIKYVKQLGYFSTDVSAIQRDLERVAILVDVKEAKTCVAAKEPRVKMLVSNLTASNPVVGFSLTKLAGSDSLTLIEASHRNVSGRSAIDFVVSPQIEKDCDRLAIFAISHFHEFYTAGSFGAHVKKMLMVVHLVLTRLDDAVERTSDGFYVDILIHKDVVSLKQGEAAENEYGDLRFDKTIMRSERDEEFLDFDELLDSGKSEPEHNRNTSEKTQEVGFEESNNVRRFGVLTWSEEDNDWTSTGCNKLKSTRSSKLVIRCETIDFNAEFRGRFLIFEPSRFVDVVGDTLLVILVVAGVLSGVGLASIISTAALQRAWRKDLGHKILLQMTLALAFNLALGFASNLFSVDTDSATCVVVGAFRHFSYLAMFAWMLIMSGLQLKRLVSVVGARGTSNLLLKVCFCAWGLPFIAVSALVVFSSDTYQSDAMDRGFCYPEGVDFLWSVQIPAGTILTVNSFIFVVILARVYAFYGWGEKENLRRHMTQRTVQMRRLKAVFFTFCLFGITWVFHFLAELGVFKEKFIYEYLFLVTASVHLFSLSCIFVFFDKCVREEWMQLVQNLRP